MFEATNERPAGTDGRAAASDAAALEALIIRLLQSEQLHPVILKKLGREVARRADSRRDGNLRTILAGLVDAGIVLDLGAGEYYLAANLDALEWRICDLLLAYHQANPFEPAMATGEIKSRFGKTRTRNVRRNIDPRLFELAMAACKRDGRVMEDDAGVRLAHFTATASREAEQRRLEQALLSYVAERRYHRIELDDLVAHLDLAPSKVRVVIAHALRQESLVNYGENRYLTAEAMARVRLILAAELTRRTSLRTAEIKALLGIPRNAIIPLLEHLDAVGFTRRDGDSRFLAATRPQRPTDGERQEFP